VESLPRSGSERLPVGHCCRHRGCRASLRKPLWGSLPILPVATLEAAHTTTDLGRVTSSCSPIRGCYGCQPFSVKNAHGNGCIGF